MTDCPDFSELQTNSQSDFRHCQDCQPCDVLAHLYRCNQAAPNWEMSDACLSAEPLIAADLDGALDEEDRAVLNLHLRDCARCMAACGVAAFDQVGAGDVPVAVAPVADNASAWAPKPLLIGSVVLAAAAVLLFVQRDSQSPAKQNTMAVTTETDAGPPEAPIPSLAGAPGQNQEKGRAKPTKHINMGVGIVVCPKHSNSPSSETHGVRSVWCVDRSGEKNGPFIAWDISDRSASWKMQRRLYTHGKPDGVWTLWKQPPITGGRAVVEMQAEFDNGKMLTYDGIQIEDRLAAAAGTRMVRIFEERLRPAASPPTITASPPRPPKVPEKLTQQEIRAGFKTLKPKVHSCNEKHSEGRVKLHVKVLIRPSGKTAEVEVSGPGPSALLRCVERVVRGAKFRRTRREIRVSYPLMLSGVQD